MFTVVYADPPWTYNDKASSGDRGASFKYPTMSIDDIYSLPVQDISAPNSALFLWVTMPLLQEGLNTMKEWGFTYKTCAFVWVKTNKKAGTNFMGMGNWTRSNAELCILGIKGKVKRQSASVRQIIEADEPTVIKAPMLGHSYKPREIADKIVELCGDVPRAELFSRTISDGWNVWGNQAPEQLNFGNIYLDMALSR